MLVYLSELTYLNKTVLLLLAIRKKYHRIIQNLMGKVKASRQAIEMLHHDLMGGTLYEINGSWMD